MDFQPQISGGTGYGAVNNLGSPGLPMPQAIMQRIAMSRAAQQQNPNLPTDAVKAGTAGLNGLTPQAMSALQALLVKNKGQSSNPGADTRLQQAVDLAYGPQAYK